MTKPVHQPFHHLTEDGFFPNATHEPLHPVLVKKKSRGVLESFQPLKRLEDTSRLERSRPERSKFFHIPPVSILWIVRVMEDGVRKGGYVDGANTG